MIVDIVGSRNAPDRVGAQRAVREAFDRADAARPVLAPLWSTAGDEFQAVYGSLADALRSTLIARLVMPDGLDFRVGLGSGEVREIERTSAGHPIQDGSAWWAARDAIEEAHRRENSGSPFVRSWYAAADESADFVATVDSYLLLRDHLVSAMTGRARRLAAGALEGRAQLDLAESEDITQSAVSQSLQRSGAAALLAAQQLMEERGAR
ncbi:SatD family protein [Amnibacterium flavum]|uniref:SatD family protein n=1 Tax=Amnibacterium flavum TaxID=2173173 RepID=UPI001F0CC6C8|nr:SatD family protein [Amnibacterium flavum]